MSTADRMHHGVVEASRQIAAPRQLVYDAWTALEHRRQWFAGPGWVEIERSLDLRVGGSEVAHGRFPDGTETIYTSRFHLIEKAVRLVYAFDMHVAGEHFSVSLAGVEFDDTDDGTLLTYTEQAFFFSGDYDEQGRSSGTEFLLGEFTGYLASLG